MSEGDWRRRQAVQIAAQLPDDPKDALAVLALARELVEGFLTPPAAFVADQGRVSVLPFRAGGPKAPSFLANSTGSAAGFPK